MEGVKSVILERKGEKDGFAERFGKVIPNGSLIFIEGKEGTGKSIFCQRVFSDKRHQLDMMSENFSWLVSYYLSPRR
jgi:archaellum biogenesis ATPase FlaH